MLYLSEMQVFQMRNVSVKTKNGLKDAQKSVKGRPNIPRKAVISQTARRSVSKVYDSINRIMNSDRPPQIPGKDYHHHTPDVDDDGWGSDFSENSDHDTSYYITPTEEQSDELYEDPLAVSDNDSEYEQPLLNTMAQAPVKNPVTTPARMNRPLPIPKGSPPRHIRANLGNRELPPDPPEEDYEDPSQGPGEEYENPENITIPIVQPRQPPHAVRQLPLPPSKRDSPPLARSPQGRQSPPPLPGTAAIPPRIPRRDIPPVPEISRVPEKTNSTNYEDPKSSTAPKSQIVSGNSEIIFKPGKLKPSAIKNYTKVDVVKSPPKKNEGLPNKLSQLMEKNSASHDSVNSELPVSKPITSHIKSPAFNTKNMPSKSQEDKREGLCSYIWYHSEMTRDVAKDRLMKKSVNGMFLVRNSSQSESPYALSLFYKGRVYNLNIRLRPDKRYALGTKKPDENSFTSVPLLIAYFQNNTLVLGGNTSTQTNLVQALPK